jgi:DNA-binding phage protein
VHNVRALRVVRGFETLVELADAAAFSRTQLYAIMRRSCDPSIDRVEQLGAALQVSPATLLRRATRGFPLS